MKNKKIVFMGTPDFAVPILQRLVQDGYCVSHVVTQPDRPRGRKRKLTPPPVKVAAEQLGIPVFQPEKLADEEVVQTFLAFEPDLVITAAYGQLLPEAVLQAPAFGCINVHASLLPKYRGGAPIHWAVINGETETGITIMYMVKELDAGDMLAKRAIPIANTDHVGILHDRLSQLGADLVSEILPPFFRGELKAIPQDNQAATYAPNIRRADEYINWRKSATQLYNQVRGLHPWPVATTTWQGKALKIWWAEVEEGNPSAEPGTIIAIDKTGISIATGEGVLKLTQVQPAGKKSMTAHDFICGAKIEVGEQLGDE